MEHQPNKVFDHAAIAQRMRQSEKEEKEVNEQTFAATARATINS